MIITQNSIKHSFKYVLSKCINSIARREFRRILTLLHQIVRQYNCQKNNLQKFSLKQKQSYFSVMKEKIYNYLSRRILIGFESSQNRNTNRLKMLGLKPAKYRFAYALTYLFLQHSTKNRFPFPANSSPVRLVNITVRTQGPRN